MKMAKEYGVVWLWTPAINELQQEVAVHKEEQIQIITNIVDGVSYLVVLLLLPIA